MILWIDDDQASLKAFIDEIKDEGFSLKMAENPDEMMHIIDNEKQNISCIIMDIMLPTGSLDSRLVKMGLTTGWELCKRLKNNEDTKNIPIIIFTIVDDSEVIQWARSNNIPFLRKKRVFPQDLLKAVCETAIWKDK